MKSINRNNIVIIHSLVFALFLSGCMSTSRHLTAVAEKDLIIQDKNMQNASLVEVKQSLKDRLSEMGRQSTRKENEQHRKIATLERIDKSRDKQIKSLKETLEAQKQKALKLEGLLAFKARQSNDLEKSLLNTRKANEQSEETLREKLQSDREKIETLQERLARMKNVSEQKSRKIQNTEKTSTELINQLRGEIKAGNVIISKMKNRLSVQIVNKVLFASGSNQVSKKGKEILKNVSQALKKVRGTTIRIEGHTDNVPISASLSEKFPSNWELSTARATQVVRYLIEEEVKPENLMAVGMSQYAPVVINNSPEGREMNRRIEIVLVPKEKF